MAKCKIPLSDLIPNNLLVAFDAIDHHSQEISRQEEALWIVKCPSFPRAAPCLVLSSPLPHLCQWKAHLSLWKSLQIPTRLILPSSLPPIMHLVHTSSHMCGPLWCSIVYGVGHLARLWDTLGQCYLYSSLYANSQHIIRTWYMLIGWVNLFCYDAHLEFRNLFLVNICAYSYLFSNFKT